MNEKIIIAARELIEGQKNCLNYLEESFEYIRYRNITRVSEIEYLLDSILSMFQTNETLDLYIRVCSYYHAFDKEGAMEYAQFYLDMYNDDRVIREIRKIEKEIKVYAKK